MDKYRAADLVSTPGTFPSGVEVDGCLPFTLPTLFLTLFLSLFMLAPLATLFPGRLISSTLPSSSAYPSRDPGLP